MRTELITQNSQLITQEITHNLKLITMNKNLWGKIINIVITVLTAIATTFGITSCMGV